MKVDGEYEFGRVLGFLLEKPINHIGVHHPRWSYMLELYTAAARSGVQWWIEIRALLQQQQYSLSEAFDFEYTYKVLLSPVELN